MDQFNFNNFPETNFNEVNLSWMLEVMSKFKEDLESGQFVGPPGPPGPKGDPGPAGDGLTEEVKQALLQLARKVAYIDDQGETYYQDLYDALYGTTPAELVSISATFNQGSAVIYESDSLDTLKQYLTVTAAYSDSSTAVIPSTDYTLSGTLTEGTSTITVSYRGKTDTFQVTVTADPVPVTLVSISAVYTQSGTVYDTDSLDSLKDDLVVTANYSDSSTQTVPAADYTLSGALTAGTSTITVSYGGKTDTFSVVVTAWDIEWVYTDGALEDNGFTKTYSSGTATMTSNGLECSGSSLAWTPNNEQTATTTIFETVFIPEILSSQNLASGNGFKLAVFNGSRAMTVGINSYGICYYDAANSGYLVATPNISTNTEYLLRIETGQIEGKIYLDGELIATTALGSTSTTNSRVFGAATAGNGKTLIKAIRFEYVT